jgi:hypothetical protein
VEGSNKYVLDCNFFEHEKLTFSLNAKLFDSQLSFPSGEPNRTVSINIDHLTIQEFEYL